MASNSLRGHGGQHYMVNNKYQNELRSNINFQFSRINGVDLHLKKLELPKGQKVKATTKNLPNQSLTQFSVLNITSYVLTFDSVTQNLAKL